MTQPHADPSAPVEAIKGRSGPAQLLPREDWLSLRNEDVLEPDLPIIDAHHHLYLWPNYRYLLDDYLRDLHSGHDIQATVYVEAASMYRRDGPACLKSLGETEFANGIAAQCASGIHGGVRACAGIVGMVDLMLGDAAEPLLEAHLAAAPLRFRGVRNPIAWHPSPEIPKRASDLGGKHLTEPNFRRGLDLLRKHGLSYDVWVYHTQLAGLADLLNAGCDTALVLNHGGGPIGVGSFAGQRNEVFEAWRKDIRRIARYPNVHLKLGGFAMRVGGFDFHAKTLPPTSEQLAEAWRPYVETCIEAFGPKRCMFESNFPVDKAMCSYVALWNAYKRLAARFSADEKRQLFYRTAQKVYRLDLACHGADAAKKDGG